MALSREDDALELLPLILWVFDYAVNHKDSGILQECLRSHNAFEVFTLRPWPDPRAVSKSNPAPACEGRTSAGWGSPVVDRSGRFWTQWAGKGVKVG